MRLADRLVALATTLVVLVGCDGASSPPPTDLRIAPGVGYVAHDVSIDLREVDAPPPDRPAKIGRVRLLDGWTVAEPWGRWTQGDRAGLLVLLPDERPTDRILELDCRTIASTDGAAQTIRVVVNNEAVGTLGPGIDWGLHALTIPAAHLRPGANAVRFEFAYTSSPAELGKSNDPRRFAVGFRGIALTATTTAAGVAPSPTQVIVPFTAAMRQGSFVLHGAGDPATVAFAGLGGSDVELVVDHEEPGGSPTLALDRLPSHEAGCVTFETDGDTDDLSLGLVDVPGAAHDAVSPATSHRAQELPDIVVLLPDAARADHFGCYGYPKATTPHVDALADESLVFREAFAIAPYTLNSVATMFTGLSWLDHRVEARGQRLADEWTTLAESLHDSGYRTIVYSANPNNSAATGSAQGVDEFVPLWNAPTPAERSDPHRMARMAIERLDRGFEGQPVFMVLHMVPPHEPYTPPAAFDVFGDPAYTGTIDGSLASIRGIDNGSIVASPVDLREMLALYDGNLRYADDAIGLVLDALRKRERWDRTAVLVVSDHGEAFAEHGRMGHNTTVHREMLHVPFVLRVPEGAAAVDVDVDTESLVSLEDIVPTLLGLAGIAPAPELTGVDLLSATDRSGRTLVARTASDRPDYAIWSAEWKLIRDRRGSSVVYDLAADALERAGAPSLSTDRLFCLERLLALARSRAREAAETTEEELSEEELETLRSLGYAQ